MRQPQQRVVRTGATGTGRWLGGVVLGAGIALVLAGCGSRGEDAPQPDIFGCPALAGTYALPDIDGQWPSFDGTPWAQFRFGQGGWVPLAWFDQVTLVTPAPGMLEARFRVRPERITGQIQSMHDLGGPRYARWHALVQPAARASYERNYGAGAYAEQLREVGPLLEASWSGTQGREFTCKDGELHFARTSGRPLRLARGPTGGVEVSGTELKTVGIPVWCGDGCKELPIPTGTREARVEWWVTQPRPDWTPDVASLKPPKEAVAEAERVRLERQAAVDRRVFASVDEIRSRLTPLLPPGGTLESVEIRDGAVHIVHRAPEGRETMFSRAVAGFGEAPRGLQVVYVTSRPTQRDVEFRLVDSALVRREPMPAWAPKDGASAAASVSPLPVLTPAAPTRRIDNAGLKASAQALLPAGMRVERASANDSGVYLVGTAPRNAVVSDGLRALDAAAQARAPNGPRVELISVAMEGGAVRYEIRVPLAALASP